MNRFMALLLIGLLTFVAVLWVKRPEVLSGIWLWVVGLAGPVIALAKRLFEEVKKKLTGHHTPQVNNTLNNSTTSSHIQIPK